MRLDEPKGLTVEELLQSHKFGILRHPTSRIEAVKLTDEIQRHVAELVIAHLESSGETLVEEPRFQKVTVLVDKFTPSSEHPDGKECDELEAMIIFYTNEGRSGAQRIPYKFVVPVEDIQVSPAEEEEERV